MDDRLSDGPHEMRTVCVVTEFREYAAFAISRSPVRSCGGPFASASRLHRLKEVTRFSTRNETPASRGRPEDGEST